MSRNKMAIVCRYGGNFIEADGKVSYKDGTNRLIYLHPEINYTTLISKLCEVCELANVKSVEYKHPTLGLDTLVSLVNDEDILYMKYAFFSQPNCPIQLFVSEAQKIVPTCSAFPRWDKGLQRDQTFEFQNGKMTRKKPIPARIH